MKKSLKILVIVAAVAALLLVGYLAYIRYLISQGELVKWDNQWYAKEQLAAKYPPQVYDVPEKNTPEEVYAAFRQALLDGEIETALGFIVEKKQEQYRNAFENKEKFDVWVKKLPATIKLENKHGNLANYDIDMNTKNKNTTTFLKNNKGYWKIDSI